LGYYSKSLNSDKMNFTHPAKSLRGQGLMPVFLAKLLDRHDAYQICISLANSRRLVIFFTHPAIFTSWAGFNACFFGKAFGQARRLSNLHFAGEQP